MQPVSTEYSGQPKTPARHLIPLLLATLALGCTADRTSGPDSAQTLADGESVDIASIAAVHGGADGLTLDLVGVGPASPGLWLIGADTTDSAAVRQPLFPRAARGPDGASLHLDVQAHRLGWHGTALQLLTPVPGVPLDPKDARQASGAVHALAEALAATTVSLAPAVSVAGERFGAALAWSPEGRFLAVASPAAERVALYPADSDGQAPADTIEHIAIDGLSRALTGSLSLVSARWASTLAIAWTDMDDQHRLAIADAWGEGYRVTSLRTSAAAADARVMIDDLGERVDLWAADGHHERFERVAERWESVMVAAPQPGTLARTLTDTSAASSSSDGGYMALRAASDGSLQIDEADGLRTHVLPGTADAGVSLLAHTARLTLDADRDWLAVTALEHGAHRIDAVLRVFERSDDGAWRAAGSWHRGPVPAHTRVDARFGQTPGAPADTLLWHWQTDDSDTGGGFEVLVRAPAAAAFNDADRSDRLPQPWQSGFSWPRDGVHLPSVARLQRTSLSSDGRALAVSRHPTDAPTADGARYHPAGDIILID